MCESLVVYKSYVHCWTQKDSLEREFCISIRPLGSCHVHFCHSVQLIHRRLRVDTLDPVSTLDSGKDSRTLSPNWNIRESDIDNLIITGSRMRHDP